MWVTQDTDLLLCPLSIVPKAMPVAHTHNSPKNNGLIISRAQDNSSLLGCFVLAMARWSDSLIVQAQNHQNRDFAIS